MNRIQLSTKYVNRQVEVYYKNYKIPPLQNGKYWLSSYDIYLDQCDCHVRFRLVEIY